MSMEAVAKLEKEMFNNHIETERDLYFFSRRYRIGLYNAYKENDPDMEDECIGEFIEETMKEWTQYQNENWMKPCF